jgi:hypothetical protein
MRILKELRREVGHGGVVPRGWQMAYYEPRRRIGVYYPAPLNWVVRGLREFSYRLQIALHAPRIEHAQVFEMQRTQRERQCLTEEYARGYLSGWRECFQACLEAVEEEIARVDNAFDTSSWLPITPKPKMKN